MQEIGDIARTVGGFVEQHPKAVPGALAGAGFISNWLQNRQRQRLLNEYESLVNNPGELAQRIAALQQPLSQGLVNNITNRAQAFLSERGLGESPNIMAAVVSQALAPYLQRAQEDAAQEYLSTLGMPLQALRTIGGPSDLSYLLQILGQSRAANPASAPGGGSTLYQDSVPSDFLDQMGVNG